MFAELRLIAADDAAAARALDDPRRIAGYPIIGSLRPLSADVARTVSQAFLDWQNYSPERRGRCALDRLVGFRFIRDQQRVDVALTDPCGFAMWTFQRSGATDEWASPFHSGLSQRIFDLVLPRGSRATIRLGDREGELLCYPSTGASATRLRRAPVELAQAMRSEQP